MGLAVAGRGQPDQGDVRTQGKGPGARQIKHFAWEHTDQLQPVRMPMGGQISQAGAGYCTRAGATEFRCVGGDGAIGACPTGELAEQVMAR